MFKQPDNLSRESLKINSSLRLFQIYKKLKYVSLKIDTYFQVYEEIFEKYVDKEIIFVEVGVLGGGSLQMWKEYHFVILDALLLVKIFRYFVL